MWAKHDAAATDWTPLPLNAASRRAADHWSVRLPVRAEQVEVRKRLMVYERVTIGTVAREGVERIADRVRRERVEVDIRGDSDAVGVDHGITGSPRERAEGPPIV